MAVVWIPALLHDLTGGSAMVHMPGATVREVIQNLDAQYPGVQERLCEAGRLRPNLAVIVDGIPKSERLRCRLNDKSEVHFLVAISGG
jgi:molybdopterin converting factor small subunit